MATAPQGGPLALFALTAGPRFGEELAIAVPVVNVGSAPGNELVIDDDSVSARHARLEFDLGAWRLTDLGSTNGTAVEGVRLAPDVPTPLHYGSEVRFGGVKLQFREVRGADPAEARSAFTAPAAEKTLKEERRGGFRMPLWLVLLLLLFVVAIVYALVVNLGGTPQPAPAVTAWVGGPAPLAAAPPIG